MNLYLDIETRPCDDEALCKRIADNVSPPARMSKPETIAAWEANEKPAAIKEAIAKTSLDGAYGRVCCIGAAVDDGKVIASTSANERKLILGFLEWCDVQFGGHVPRFPTIVGHNVGDFDIRFLWQRAIVLGIRMPAWFPRDPKPWGNDVFDTMTAWAGARNRVSMDNLCAALGMDGKGDIDGSMVAQLWAEGRHDEIAAYCAQDVERTRAIHRKMMVAYGSADYAEAAE